MDKEVEQDQKTKAYLRDKVDEYMEQLINKQTQDGQYYEQVHIESNSTGHSYMAVFGRLLDENVRYVRVEDPYVRSFHQCQNFLRLCELLVRSCVNLRVIELVTKSDSKCEESQKEWFGSINVDLDNYNMKLNVVYSDTLRERQILLSSGWVIKIGRGLDIYKPPANRFCLGVHDLDLRPCHETTVDIVYSNDVRQRYGPISISIR